MNLSKSMAALVFVLAASMLASDANAFWGHHARRAAYYGYGYGYGYGITTVSYAPSVYYGGYWGYGRHYARRAARYAYAGSWGYRTPVYGCCDYCGSYSCYGYCAPVYRVSSYCCPTYTNDCCGTPVTYGYGSETVVEPSPAAAPGIDVDAPAGDAPSVLENGDGTTSLFRHGRAQLTVALPPEASLFVNGRKTRTPGAERRFVSPDLETGRSYVYQLRVELNQDGKQISRHRTVRLRAGENQRVAFDLDQAPPVETRVVLNVPKDASVTLSGVSSSMKGTQRVFSTTKLAVGQEWGNYTIRVTTTRDGRELSKEKTVTLKGGDTVELAFRFDEVELASR